jgi:hypothetical protein
MHDLIVLFSVEMDARQVQEQVCGKCRQPRRAALKANRVIEPDGGIV